MIPVALSAADVEKILSMPYGQEEFVAACRRLKIGVGEECVRIDGQTLPREELEKPLSEKVIYTIIEGRLEKLQFFSGHLYKLSPSGGYPALEIDGVRMHRTKDMFPEEEARVKIKSLGVLPGNSVLDICTGLGYSSQEAALRGAKVLTIEKNYQVIYLARFNPCCFEFFQHLDSGKIKLLIGDAARLLWTLPDKSFDRIIHDPPSFPLAGELYSSSFYKELRRLIRNDGALLHYTGQPGSRYRRLDLKKSVSRRLNEVGFSTRWNQRARSVLAYPRRNE